MIILTPFVKRTAQKDKLNVRDFFQHVMFVYQVNAILFYDLKKKLATWNLFLRK